VSFRVAARTVLELGAELISSDAVAIYELVKNAIDARSPDGVTIEFCVTLQHSDYVDALASAKDIAARRRGANRARAPVPDSELADLKTTTISRMLPTSVPAARQALEAAVGQAATLDDFVSALKVAYATNNWIEFRDSGRGMSKTDLLDAYLVIGTPSRRRELDATVAAGRGEAPYLGEKGVGRLSAMRLGTGLVVTTATEADKHLNLLEVDWSAFEDLDKMIEDVVLSPQQGGRKPRSDYSGTTIRITGPNANWSPNRIKDIATLELSRLSDPFSQAKRRFRVAVLFNDERIDIPRLDRAVLDLAHARATGRYLLDDGKAKLEVVLWCGDLGRGNPPDERRIYLDGIDLRSLTRDSTNEIPASALRTVGPFTFELYWYNRRLLRGVDAIGERKRVLALQHQWSGIMLFRNGYRVFPYGNDEDDWLGLDRKALASSGYKLNKAQFIGRVSISRTGNPHLVDQTNREGLKDCDEKGVLIEVLKFIIQDRMRAFLDEVERRYKTVELDFEEAEKRIRNLEMRATVSLREIEKRHVEEKPQLRELLALFEEMRSYFAAAKQRAEQVEDERDRMLQLAGVGLMLEIVAHELARSTEATLKLLDSAEPDELPDDVASLFGTLRDEMKSMNRRLRVLDPLSVSGRQRKETFDFVTLIREIFAGHAAQFKRHHVEPTIEVASGRRQVMVNGVRGMFVQIIENLVQNSIYWMDLRRLDEDDFRPQITVRIDQSPNLLDYTDNGPGIQPSLRDEVFKAFFSTKGKTRRQGLGLYIARDCATHHGGQLFLSDERRIHADRLNTFILEIPSTVQ
jgi:signal transduction histidine kinase